MYKAAFEILKIAGGANLLHPPPPLVFPLFLFYEMTTGLCVCLYVCLNVCLHVHVVIYLLLSSALEVFSNCTTLKNTL